MKLFAWFRGLFSKPKKQKAKSRNALKTKGITIIMPPVGRLSYKDSARVCRAFAPQYNDEQIARMLNRMGYTTGMGHRWTKGNVRWHRNKTNSNAMPANQYPSLYERMNIQTRQNAIN